MISEKKFSEACNVLREQVKISDYLSENKLMYGKKEEGIIRCPFPDHDDSTASFSYEDGKELFNCFGCGRGGDIVNLHYYMESIEDERYTRIKAVKDLSKKFKVKLPNLYKENISKGRVNKYKRLKERKANKEVFYKEKIKGLEPYIKKLPLEEKVELYKDIDQLFLGKIKSKELFFKIRRKIRNESD